MRSLMMIHTIAIFFLAAIPISQKYADAGQIAILAAMFSTLAYAIFWKYLGKNQRSWYKKLAEVLGKIKGPLIATFFLYEVSTQVWENWVKSVSIYVIALAFLLVCLYGALEKKNRVLQMAEIGGFVIIAWFACILVYGVIESVWLLNFSFPRIESVFEYAGSIWKSIGIGIGIGLFFSPVEEWITDIWESGENKEDFSVKTMFGGWFLGFVFSVALYVFQLQVQALPVILICAYFGVCPGIKIFQIQKGQKETKKVAYYLAALLIAVLTVIIAPNWKNLVREKNSQIEDRDYITAIGVEKAEKGYRITYGIADVKSVALGEADSSRIHVSDLTVLFGENWKELANKNLDRALDFSHVQAIILSKDCQEYDSEYQKLLKELQKQFSLRKNVFCFDTKEDMTKIFAYNDAVPGGIGLYLGDLVKERRNVKTATLTEVIQRNPKLWQLDIEIFSQKVRLETSDSESGT